MTKRRYGRSVYETSIAGSVRHSRRYSEGSSQKLRELHILQNCQPGLFKQHLRQHVIRRITNALQVHDQELATQSRNTWRYGSLESFLGLNLGFTKDGVVQLRGIRPSLDPAFEKGANHPDTIKNLNDPPLSNWLKEFISDRIDGILLVTGRDQSSLTFHSNHLLRSLGSSRLIPLSQVDQYLGLAGQIRDGAGFDFSGGLDRSARIPVAVLRRRGSRRTVGRPLRGLSRPTISQ
jgi:hypothetical protein